MRSCKYCNVELVDSGSYPNRQYCSRECISLMVRSLKRAINPRPVGLPTGTVGAISEMEICQDLLSRGYDVFRAVSQSASCDLIAKLGKTLISIEVTTGTYTPKGKISHPKKDPEKHDVLAVVTYREIIYSGKKLREPLPTS